MKILNTNAIDIFRRQGVVKCSIPRILLRATHELCAISREIHNLSDNVLEKFARHDRSGLRGLSGYATPEHSQRSEAERKRSYRSFELGHYMDPSSSISPELAAFLNAPNVWPDEIVHRARDVERSLQSYKVVSTAILAQVLETSLSELSHFFSSPTGNMRLLKYSSSLNPNIPIHFDYEFITLIHATHPSLIVQMGDKLVALDEQPDELIILAGDSLEYLTSGKIPAVAHGARPTQERYATIYFLNCNADVRIDRDGLFFHSADQGFSPAEHVVGMNLANNALLREKFSGTSLSRLIPADLKNPFRSN